jgi:WD40 repeat protein
LEIGFVKNPDIEGELGQHAHNVSNMKATFRKLEGHDFDITDLLIIFNPPEDESNAVGARLSETSATSRPDSARSTTSVSKLGLNNMPVPCWAKFPLIVSSCMDNTLRIWSYATGETMLIIGPLSTHSVSLEITKENIPILSAGGGTAHSRTGT